MPSISFFVVAIMSVDPVYMRGLWRTMIPAVDRGPVAFRRSTSLTTYTTTEITDAWFRQGSVHEADTSNGAYLVEELTWYIPRELLATQPTVGDGIAVTTTHKSGYPLAGNVYTVGTKGSSAVNAEGVWKCETVRPYINPSRAETINIYRPEPGISSDGFIEDGTATLLAGPLTAAIQVSDTFAVAPVQAEEAEGRFQLKNPVRIFLPVIVRVQPNDYVVRSSDGLRYTILNDSNVNKVGEFMSLDCVLSQ